MAGLTIFFCFILSDNVIFVEPAYLLDDSSYYPLQIAWTYDNQDQWDLLCNEGKEQTPIDLQCAVPDDITLPPLEFLSYDKHFFASIENNGRTVKMTLKKTNESQAMPTIKSGGLKADYVFSQMHIHWKAEHTFNDYRYPLEIHLVHRASIYNSTKVAVEHRYGVAVLGILVSISPEPNKDLDPFLRHLKDVKHRPFNLTVTTDPIQLSSFIPRDPSGFYRYIGSLTTPRCNEGIIWSVFTSTLLMSRAQVAHFNDFWADESGTVIKHNFKNLRDCYGRRVYIRRSEAASDVYAADRRLRNRSRSGSGTYFYHRQSSLQFVYILLMNAFLLNLTFSSYF